MSLQLEMRCDRGLVWFPSRYIPPAAEHSMSLQLFWVVAVLVCKRSSSDLVRHEPNSIEMRCDIAWMWWLFWFAKGGGYPRLQRVVVILVCKGSSSDLVRHEPNSIEMRCDGGLI
jgi:hypothetical protein